MLLDNDPVQSSRRGRVLTVLIAALGGLGACGGQQQQAMCPKTGVEQKKFAQEELEKGRSLVPSSEKAGAYHAFRQAWWCDTSCETALSLEMAELDLAEDTSDKEQRRSLLREAAYHQNYFKTFCSETEASDIISKYYSKSDESDRNFLEMSAPYEFEAFRRYLVRIEFSLTADTNRSTEGAVLKADGEDLGTIKGHEFVQRLDVKGDLYLQPRTWRFSASLVGCDEASKIVDLTNLSIPYEKVELKIPCRKKGKIFPTVVIGAMGTFAFGVLGGALLTKSSDKSEEANTSWGQLYVASGTSACSRPANQNQCTTMTNAINTSELLTVFGVTSLIAGSATGALTVYYVLTRDEWDWGEKSTAFSVSPSIGGVVVQGSF